MIIVNLFTYLFDIGKSYRALAKRADLFLRFIPRKLANAKRFRDKPLPAFTL